MTRWAHQWEINKQNNTFIIADLERKEIWQRNRQRNVWGWSGGVQVRAFRPLIQRRLKEGKGWRKSVSEGKRRTHALATVARRCRRAGEGSPRVCWREGALCWMSEVKCTRPKSSLPSLKRCVGAVLEARRLLDDVYWTLFSIVCLLTCLARY